MKRSKFTEVQIAFVLRQAEGGIAVAEVCRKTGISEARFYAWRRKYAGLMPSEMKRATARGGERQAEADRRRPVARQGGAAGRDLPQTMKPDRRRRVVDDVRATWRVSIRRACSVLRTQPSTCHYKSRRGDQAPLRKRIGEIAETRAL